jgi:predicted  nucleic acid-binding Zn-ribbon protein
MSLSSDLFRLQKIDSQRDQASSRIREIEMVLKSDEALLRAQELVSSADQDLNQSQKILKRAEESVRSQNIKIEQNQASLYGGKVRNPKELQDLQNEAAALKRHLIILEDEQLEAMFAVEEAEKALHNAKNKLKDAEASAIEKQSSLIGERDRLLREVSQIETERQSIIRSLPAENIAVYDRIRQQKRGIAVARATDETCSACGAMLTPKEWQLARSPHHLFYCPSCGRILYAG